MPRYFFHIRDGVQLVQDPDGTILPDLTAARVEALVDARSLVSETIRAGKVLNGQHIEIVDEAGQVLDVLPFRDAIRLE